MTITRRWQAGAEYGDITVEVTGRDSTGATIDVTTNEAKTGTHSFRGQSDQGFWQDISATSQLRVGFHVKHDGTDPGDTPGIVGLKSGSTDVATVRWDGDNSTMQLYVGGVQQDTAVLSDFADTSTWFHFGIDAKIDASGWVHVYLDGTLVLSFSGDTTTGASTVNRVEFNQQVATSNNWDSFIYFDDCFIDDTTGEANAAVVPDLRFELVLADTETATINWTPSSGADNAALVDDVPPDGDTAYVFAESAGLDDLYNPATYTLPSGHTLQAVIPGAVAKKTDGSVDSELALLLDDGTNTTVVAAQDLGTSYDLVDGREENAPDGAAWTQAKVNAVDLGIRSAGSYS